MRFPLTKVKSKDIRWRTPKDNSTCSCQKFGHWFLIFGWGVSPWRGTYAGSLKDYRCKGFTYATLCNRAGLWVLMWGRVQYNILEEQNFCRALVFVWKTPWLAPRGFTLQNTTLRASLRFSKWHPFHSIIDLALSNPFQSMTVRITNLVQTPTTLWIVQKRNPLHFPYIHPLVVNILACLDVSRLAKSGGVASYQN